MENRNVGKFKSLITGTSNWLQKAKQRKINEAWLKKSQDIALKILLELKEKDLTQSELAITLDVTPQYVNRIVKGLENLTLETICKIEVALGVELIKTNSSDIVLNEVIVTGNNLDKINEVLNSPENELKNGKPKNSVTLTEDMWAGLQETGEENSYAMAA